MGQLVYQTSFQFNGTVVETLCVDMACSFLEILDASGEQTVDRCSSPWFPSHCCVGSPIRLLVIGPAVMAGWSKQGLAAWMIWL
jgi:hypothetical protein